MLVCKSARTSVVIDFRRVCMCSCFHDAAYRDKILSGCIAVGLDVMGAHAPIGPHVHWERLLFCSPLFNKENIYGSLFL